MSSRKWSRKCALSAAALLLLAWRFTDLPAQTITGKIMGRVTDARTGEALSGASVVLTAEGFKTGVTTTSNGTYEIRGIWPGAYKLTVSYVGYVEKVVADVLLGAGETESLNISLQPTQVELSPMTVFASRPQERAIAPPPAVNVLDREAIQARPALTPAEHLKGVPSVDIISTGLNSSNIVVRGFNSAFSGRLLTLTDYRIANLPGLRANAYQRLIPMTDDDLDRIEVLQGPSAALYGPNAAGGIIHMITKSPFDSKGTVVHAGIGERGVRTAAFRHAGTLGRRVGYKVSAQYRRGKDWEYKDPAEPDSITYGIWTPEGRIAQGGKVPNRRDLGILGFSTDARLDIRSENGLTGVLSGGYIRTDDIEITGIGAYQVRHAITDYVQGRLIYRDLFVQAFLNWSGDSGPIRNLRNGDILFDASRQFVTQAQHGLTLGKGRQRLVYGLDLLFTRPHSGGAIYGRNEDRDAVNGAGAYLQSETRLSSKVRLVGAARVDHQNTLEALAFSPRASLSFQPNANHTLQAAWGRAFDNLGVQENFLDINVLPTLGPLPFAVWVRGVPPKTGYTFRRDAGGGVGGLYMRSPFVPESAGGRAAQLPADATQMWPVVVAILKAQKIDLSALPPPDAKQVGTDLRAYNPTIGAFQEVAPQTFTDLPPLKPLGTTTYEIGYRGVLREKLYLNVNLYHERDFNFGSFVAMPNVFLNGRDLAAYLSRFMPEKDATALANGVSGIPLGTVTPVQDGTADLFTTFRNFKGVVYAYDGAEVGLAYYPAPAWSLSANYTHRSKNRFPKTGDALNDLSLGAAKDKFGASVSYKDPKRGVNGGLRLSYVGSFPLNSGILSTTIKAYWVLDLNATCELPFDRRLSVSLLIQNLLNNRHREWIISPEIGRLAMARLTCSLKPSGK